MQIEIPATQEHRLALHAKAEGYSDVERFVAAQLQQIAQQPTTEELGPVEEAAAREMIRRGEADINAGRTQDMEEALLELGKRRGYTLGE